MWNNKNLHSMLVEMQKWFKQKWQPTPIFLPRKFHGQRSLAGYSPWGRKELDTTNQLHFLSFFKKLNILLIHNPQITLLGIYPKELKETCTQIFVAALFITAQTWKQPRSLSIGESINKLWNIQTVKYLVLKRDKLLSLEKTWGKLQCILLKKPHWKCYMLYDSNDMTFWKRQN